MTIAIEVSIRKGGARMHYRDAMQVVQGLALMRFPWTTLTAATRHTLAVAVYNQASRWEQTGPLAAMEVLLTDNLEPSTTFFFLFPSPLFF